MLLTYRITTNQRGKTLIKFLVIMLPLNNTRTATILAKEIGIFNIAVSTFPDIAK